MLLEIHTFAYILITNCLLTNMKYHSLDLPAFHICNNILQFSNGSPMSIFISYICSYADIELHDIWPANACLRCSVSKPTPKAPQNV